MTRKKFIKLLMSRGYDKRTASDIANIVCDLGYSYQILWDDLQLHSPTLGMTNIITPDMLEIFVQNGLDNISRHLKSFVHIFSIFISGLVNAAQVKNYNLSDK